MSDLFRISSLKSFGKYFSLHHFKFIIECLGKGSHILTTYNESGKPVLTTYFYVDGDLLNFIHEDEDGTMTAQNHPDLVRDHFYNLESNMQAIELLTTQIQAVATFLIGGFVAIKGYLEYNLETSVISTLTVSGVILLLRKSFARVVLWSVKMIIRHYLMRLKKEVLG